MKGENFRERESENRTSEKLFKIGNLTKHDCSLERIVLKRKNIENKKINRKKTVPSN